MARTPLRTAREHVAANLDPLDVAIRMLTADAHLIDTIEAQISEATGNPTQADRRAIDIATRFAALRARTVELKRAHEDLIRSIKNTESRLPEGHR
jgi:hypothetical protein